MLYYNYWLRNSESLTWTPTWLCLLTANRKPSVNAMASLTKLSANQTPHCSAFSVWLKANTNRTKCQTCKKLLKTCFVNYNQLQCLIWVTLLSQKEFKKKSPVSCCWSLKCMKDSESWLTKRKLRPNLKLPLGRHKPWQQKRCIKKSSSSGVCCKKPSPPHLSDFLVFLIFRLLTKLTL